MPAAVPDDKKKKLGISVPMTDADQERFRQMKSASRVGAGTIARELMLAFLSVYERTQQPPKSIVGAMVAYTRDLTVEQIRMAEAKRPRKGSKPKLEPATVSEPSQTISPDAEIHADLNRLEVSLPLLGNIDMSNDFAVTPIDDRWVRIPLWIKPPSNRCYALRGYALRGQGLSLAGGVESSIGESTIVDGSYFLFVPESSPEQSDVLHLEWEEGRKSAVKEFLELDRETDEYVFRAFNPTEEPFRFQRGSVEVRGRLLAGWKPRPDEK